MRSSLALLAVVLAGGAPPLTPTQHRLADALVSEFENSTPTPQYCYVAALGDGRGYTVGRAGFTSATGDLLEVVERYTAAVPANRLARFLPRLRALARGASPSLRGLAGFPAAWRATCRLAAQRAAQDAVVAKEYLDPAVRTWRALGLRTPLSLAALYDAEIQHGPGPDPDGVPALVRRTLARAGTVAHAGEKAWLLAFLAVRRADLLHPADQATQAEWAQSVDRVDVWVYLVGTGQWSLSPPVVVRTKEYRLRLR
jgi:chitosanase